MPKENIVDMVQSRWRTEVSWRAEERVCSCNTIWSAPVPDCPECGRKDVPITSGHVQIACINQDSPFEFPEVKTEGHWQAAVPFDGWHVTLDADGIDRLMAALRRAKMQAFPPSNQDSGVTHTADPSMRVEYRPGA